MDAADAGVVDQDRYRFPGVFSFVGRRYILLARGGGIAMSVQAESSQRWETSRRAIEAFAGTVTIGALTGFVAGPRR